MVHAWRERTRSPDNEFAIVYVDYGNGYLTLYVGMDEEITDDDGVDFTVVAQGGEYAVSVGSSLDVLFTMLGAGQGNQSFDLAAAGVESARYVRVECFSDDSVELDAVVALSFNAPPGDSMSPQISEIPDFWIPENHTSTTLSWTASDATPWGYHILVNRTVAASGIWYGSDIVCNFEIASVGWWNVTFVLQDAFGNTATDSVMIEVRLIPSTTTTIPYGIDGLLAATVIGFGIVSVVIIWFFVRRRQ